MNFEDALDLLTKQHSNGYTGFYFGSPELLVYEKDGEDIGDWDVRVLTQDDIDSILALIGWDYELYFDEEAPAPNTTSGRRWYFTAHQKGNPYCPCLGGNNINFHQTKLDAAKAALIAVVEKVYPTT